MAVVLLFYPFRPNHLFPELMNGAKGIEPPLPFGCLRDEARDRMKIPSSPTLLPFHSVSRLAPVQWPRRFSRLGLLSYPALPRPPMRGQEYKVILLPTHLGHTLGVFPLDTNA